MDNKKLILFPEKSKRGVTVEELQATFITESVTFAELAEMYGLPESTIRAVAKESEWIELRKAYIRSGVAKIQNSQIQQAEKLLSLENGFKKLKLIQLESQMASFSAYYARYGHLYKVYPGTEEILLDTNGLAIPLKIPDISKEIKDLKESINIGDGITKILDRLEQLMLIGQPIKALEAPDEVDISEFEGVFEKKPEDIIYEDDSEK
jgi:hypothetical protein